MYLYKILGKLLCADKLCYKPLFHHYFDYNIKIILTQWLYKLFFEHDN